jgi:DNA polymerase V
VNIATPCIASKAATSAKWTGHSCRNIECCNNIEHPAATFAIRIEGESMTGAGIFPGDIAIVDRAREPVDGNVILALLDGAFTVKRYRIKDGTVRLQAENPAFPDMPLSDGQSFEVWGVIKRCIRML